jgi:hypothetical protein
LNSDDVLEVRITGLYGRTCYKAKAALTDKKKVKDIFNTLIYKFGVDPCLANSIDGLKGWFD